MSEYTNTVSVARDYYNSEDADTFYHKIWGGEDIHIGLYQSASEPIFEASRRTVERMASYLKSLTKESHVLDIGSGYGGAARFLAKTYGCRVTALNLSEVENERNRTMNREAGLDLLIRVVDGSFEKIPSPDASFSIAWSQDAILHSGNREAVLREIFRVLKPGGEFIFTDPMQSDTCPPHVLQPIFDRIHLETMGSPKFYRETAKSIGFEEIGFEDRTEQLTRHYGRVLEETERQETELSALVSPAYIQNMKKGLGHWIDGGGKGYLAWGIFHFVKPR